MEQFALGELGLKHKALYKMDLRTFVNYSIGMERKRYHDYQSQWESTRQIMYAVLKPHINSRRFPDFSPVDVLQLPWDKKTDEQNQILPTEEEIQKTIDFWEEVDRRRKKKERN